MSDLKLLATADQAAEMLSIGRSTFWREVKVGNLPKPIKLGSITRWRVADIVRHRQSGAPVVTECEPEPSPPPKFVIRPRGCHLYRHFDAAGTLLYVGISLSAISRLEGHRNDSAWYWSVATVTIDVYPTREKAEEAERQAIKTERPIFNRTYGDKARCDIALEML